MQAEQIPQLFECGGIADTLNVDPENAWRLVSKLPQRSHVIQVSLFDSICAVGDNV